MKSDEFGNMVWILLMFVDFSPRKLILLILLLAGAAPNHKVISLKTKADFWKNVTYSISKKTVKNEKQLKAAFDNFRERFKYLEKWTCLRFKELNRANNSANIKLVPTYQKEGEEKHCTAGGRGPEKIRGSINVLSKCVGERIGYHETGHVLGMHHTMVRSDRDRYVTVLEDNIKPPELSAYSPKKKTPYETLMPYDYGSIMHYPPYVFSNGKGPTMEAKDPFYQQTMGMDRTPSFLDIYAWNRGYKCDCVRKQPENPILGLVSILIEKLCINGGYPDPNNCGKCKCPSGFGGKWCADPEGLDNANYTDCGIGVVQASDSEQWQKFERHWTTKESMRCVWHFKGYNGRVEIRNVSKRSGALEIKTGKNVSLDDQSKPDWRLTGYKFGRALPKSLKDKVIRSVSDRLVVILESRSSNKISLEFRSGATSLSVALFAFILQLLVFIVQ